MEHVPKGAHVTGTRRDALDAELAARYADGASLRTLMSESGRSYGSVRNAVVRSGMPLRRRGGQRRP